MIDNPGLSRLASIESGPSILDLLGGRFDQQAFLNQFLPQRVDPLAERPTCGGITAFPENERSRQQGKTPLDDSLIGRIRRRVPLVRSVPDGEQPNRVEKNRR